MRLRRTPGGFSPLPYRWRPLVEDLPFEMFTRRNLPHWCWRHLEGTCLLLRPWPGERRRVVVLVLKSTSVASVVSHGGTLHQRPCNGSLDEAPESFCQLAWVDEERPDEIAHEDGHIWNGLALQQCYAPQVTIGRLRGLDPFPGEVVAPRALQGPAMVPPREPEVRKVEQPVILPDGRKGRQIGWDF